MSLLLLEDDPRLRALSASGWQKSGPKAEETGSGREGFNIALAGGFDALILDVNLPESQDASSQLAQLFRQFSACEKKDTRH